MSESVWEFLALSPHTMAHTQDRSS